MDAGYFDFKDEPERRAKSGAKAEKAEEWGEPVDILADPKLTGLASVDADCLPASILAHARAEGARLQVDPAHIAALDIGVLSAVASDDWRIRLKVNDQSWMERPCIWTGVVAESGRRKTDCFKSSTHGVAQVEEKHRAIHQKRVAQYKREHAEWEAKPKKERGPEPKCPAERRLATDDFTVEVLSDLLPASGKILLRSDELAAMLGVFDRYSKGGTVNAGRAHVLALYDGGPRRIDRVQRGKVYVPNWSAVPVGHIQPDKVRPVVGGLSDDGLLQRFMLVLPPRVEVADPDDDDIATDLEAVARFDEITDVLASMRPPETLGGDGRPEPGVVKAGTDVQPIRRQLFRLIERIEADPTLAPPLKQATSKWRGLLARLSLLFHCVELAERRLDGEHIDPVDMTTLSAETVRKACIFIKRVVVPSTFRFHTEIGTTGVSESHARWIAGHLLSRELKPITARDIGRAYREIRGKTAEIVAAMELLEHAGWVLPDSDRPRAAPGWLVNPLIHEVFQAQAAAEKTRREAARERLRVSIADLAS